MLTPGIAGLLAAADEESALDVAFGATPPVVIVIFDQLPLISLLDADGRIDPALYPHFAALASESTWFRNASAVAEYTSFALPAILTGNYPERGRLPVAADYPENLFTLLGGRYRLHVQEPLTELCPAALCPPRRAPPTARRAGILSDLAVVYLAVILPDDLAARLPPVTQGWRDFTARTTFTERFFAPRPDPRDTAAAFLDSVSDAAAGDRPPLYFLHVLLPHHPWMLLRTGQRFTLQRGDVGLSNERWLDDEWAATIRYQRHLLQLQYVDTVVGALVSQLRDAGVYDDALIVITADHGASLRSGFPFLQATEASFVDIAAVPLFFKSPGQRQGETVDANVETIDILPTLAAVLGVRLPWTADGANVLDPVGDFIPAHITGSAAVPDGAPPPLLAVALNGVVAAITRPYPFSVSGRDGAWEAIVDPGLLQPGANTLAVFTVEERADGCAAGRHGRRLPWAGTHRGPCVPLDHRGGRCCAVRKLTRNVPYPQTR